MAKKSKASKTIPKPKMGKVKRGRPKKPKVDEAITEGMKVKPVKDVKIVLKGKPVKEIY
jgi:hypothetical protein